MSWHRFLPRFASAVWPTPCHDLTGSFWAPILAALRPGRSDAARASYAPCERCGTLVRGAHTCGASAASPSAAEAGLYALGALVMRAELQANGIDTPPLPPEVVALGRSYAGRALRSCRPVTAAQLSLELAPASVANDAQIN